MLPALLDRHESRAGIAQVSRARIGVGGKGGLAPCANLCVAQRVLDERLLVFHLL